MTKRFGEVWKAYTDVRLALRRLEVAAALRGRFPEVLRGYTGIVPSRSRDTH